MLREIADIWVVVPIGERVIDFNGLISLSESAALLWRKLQEGASKELLIAALLEEYEIDADTANRDVCEFINSLEEGGVLE